MFSRYKKSAAAAPAGTVRPAAAAPVPQVPIAATPETPKPGVQRRMMPGAPVSAQAAAADKDRKRKERMGELKV